MRMIDYDAVMKALEEEYQWQDDEKVAHEMLNVVKYFPTVETPHWIPCSERLPKNPTDNYNLKEYLVCNARGWVTTISWCDGWNCCFDKDGNLYKDNEMKDIIAWMPLPEPYKESDEC